LKQNDLKEDCPLIYPTMLRHCTMFFDEAKCFQKTYLRLQRCNGSGDPLVKELTELTYQIKV